MTAHQLKHEIGTNPDNAFFCTECKGLYKIFKTAEELETHKQLMHGENGVPTECPECGKTIKLAGRMVRHIQKCRIDIKIAAEGGILCITCGKCCESKAALKTHINSRGKWHNNKCAICPDVEFFSWEDHRYATSLIATSYGMSYVPHFTQNCFESSQAAEVLAK